MQEPIKLIVFTYIHRRIIAWFYVDGDRIGMALFT